MDAIIKRVFEALDSTHFPLTHEITLHQKIEELFNRSEIPFQREVFLSKSDKVDFLIDDGIALEVKIKGSAMSIYRQCERYCSNEMVRSIILASSKPIGFPKEINNKPAYFFNLTGNSLL